LYLDLYLIHWPVAIDKETGKVDDYLTEHPVKTWKVLEELVRKGKIRNIGVSKYVPVRSTMPSLSRTYILLSTVSTSAASSTSPPRTSPSSPP
jgi:aryl-alcohol dehydrogenase-like predicted oxidoreductase